METPEALGLLFLAEYSKHIDSKVRVGGTQLAANDRGIRDAREGAECWESE